MSNYVGKNFDLDDLRKDPNVKIAWIPSWDKEVNPPAYIIDGENNTWIYQGQSDDEINNYVRLIGYELPKDLTWD